jgi:hypothetical protein
MSRTWAGRAGTAVGATLLVLTLQTPANALPYDGTSPVSTGCNSTAITAATATIAYPSAVGNIPIATVDLRYSTACRTTWSHVHSQVAACDANGNGCFYAKVYRNSDGVSYSQTSPVGATGVFSKQLNDANVTSYASSCMHYAGGYWCAYTASY